jgi:hypothetical protein
MAANSKEQFNLKFVANVKYLTIGYHFLSILTTFIDSGGWVSRVYIEDCDGHWDLT